jgi:tetratricopeptide (TPR) repeat protein
MRRIVFLVMGLMWGAAAQGESLLPLLDHKDPATRKAAMTVVGELKMDDPDVIEKLINRYSDAQEHAEVLGAVRQALKRITGIDFKSPREARGWWEEEKPRRSAAQSPDVRLARLERSLQEFAGPGGTIKNLDKKLQTDEDLFQLIFFANLVLNLLFVVVIIAFAVMGGSRLKAMRETIRQAERYVTAAEDVHKRFDGIVNDIEAKKTEILDFFRKLREEHQGEIERYTELLEQNTEHRVREEAMGLRRKGERELEETLQQLKTSVQEEIRRQVEEQKTAMAAQVQSQEKRFLQEAEAHTLFLEGALFAQHGRNEKAVRVYRRVLALDSRHAMAWIHLGTALRRLGRYEEAHEAYRKGLEIVPNSAQAFYGVAATYALQRNRDRMLAVLAQGVQSDGELRDDALNDPDFREYWQDPSF